VNDAAVEVMGYSREEFRSIGLTGIDSNLDPEEIKGLVGGMPADEVQVFETVHTTKDGKKIPVEISSSLVTYQGKQAILSIARNITERKRAEETLRQSEERYRTVFENTGTAMCIIEEDTTLSMVNRRFEELSGYSWEKLEGKKWTEFVTKNSLERMKRYHEARRKRGEKAPTHYPFDFVNKKGQIRNGMLTINLIPGTKKSVASILDITESKKTEKALWEVEEKYRKTIINANVGIIGYSPEGEVKLLNPKMEQMTGFKKSEIPTLRDWFEKLYPNKEERCNIRDKWFKRMSEEGEVQGGHAIITTKDDKRRNFLFNAVRLESGDSIAFAEDITERKEAEEKLDGMMNELVTINEKLGVVGKLTRHDARNKLSVIANNVYLAKQRLAADHTTLEYLGDIESAIDQMEELFDFAKTYEMLGVEELSYMNVEKSVNEANMLFSGLSSVKLVNECQGLTVMADSLLRQLFYNLIDDTLKHGEKVSQIRVYYEEGEDQLKLIYEDDGIGIPNDEKEKIFKEGYGKGTGYGLYLIKKICEAYGWTIQETGVPGKGAQFTMTIPKMNKSGKMSYIIN
jgi:PAS domain S-box-containing protein